MSGQCVYPEGLLAEKVGMTQIFTDEGQCVPVTVLRTGPCYVVDVRDNAKNGYGAVQLGFTPMKPQRLTKAVRGHLEKAGRGAFRHIREMRCDVERLGWTEKGKEILAADVFNSGDLVDVTGVSKGRGFQGVVRRWGAKGQPSTRGTHETRRNIGSIGCRKYPGRVFKNKHLPGQMGDERVTTLNLKVVQVIPEEHVVLVRGSVPGAKGGLVIIRKAVQKAEPAAAKK